MSNHSGSSGARRATRPIRACRNKVGRVAPRAPDFAHWLAFWLILLGVIATAHAADPLPSAPKDYFNDYAGVTRPATRQQLETALAECDRQTSVQIVVAIFQKLPDNAALEDFTQRTAEAWKVGRKGLNNGAVLFVFIEDRKMRIEVAYGLEGAIPDAIAKRIIAEEIRPRFQRGDYDGGISAGANALMKAARGESKNVGQIGKPFRHPWPLYVFVALCLLIALSSFRRRGRGTTFSRRGRSSGGLWPVVISSGNWGGGGGGWSSGGGGGFSGGGGSFGGGGASGSW